MKDWEAYKLIRDLMEKLDHSAPAEFTMDAATGWFDAVNDVEKKLREARKPFEDNLYAKYMRHNQLPWCDTCGGRVAGYASGWEHLDESLNGDVYMKHEITTKGYHWGWEALIEKRLRFEIDH